MVLSRISGKLRRALSLGAVGSTARALFRGTSLSEVGAFIGRNFGITAEVETADIIGRAQAARVAGDLIKGAGENERHPIDVAPLNPFLGEELVEGDRVLHEVIVPWFDTKTGSFGEFLFRVPHNEILTPREIQDLALEFIEGLKNDYGLEKFRGGADLEDIVVGQFEIPDVERRF